MAKGFSLNELMNAQSRPDERHQRFEAREIPIGQLKPSAKNVYGIRDIEELAASIETMGLMHDLLVKPMDAEGRHEIISGERRYRACLLLHEADAAKFATVPCKVAEAESDALSELRLIYANATARELTDYEKTYQAGRIKELLLQLKAEGYRFQGRLRDIVAAMFSVSPTQMARMDSINERLNEGIKAEFASGNIGISTAYDASTLPEAKQAEALDALRAGDQQVLKRAIRERRTPVAKTEAPTVLPPPSSELLQPVKPSVLQSIDARLDHMQQDRSVVAKRLARQLRVAAQTIPYDAVCDDQGEEINLRATCLSAAAFLTTI
jgi:ParB family chromosome partitioning protein